MNPALPQRDSNLFRTDSEIKVHDQIQPAVGINPEPCCRDQPLSDQIEPATLG